MRASTLFALTLALLIGLGVAVGARWSGWFVKPAEAPAKKEIQVLVAAKNLFAGDLMDASSVKIRPLHPDEEVHYKANKQMYLPPVPQAASLRVARKTIEADSPLLREDLKELAKPDALSLRLIPNMRALNVKADKDQSAGGLIQVGEWVDVFLTTTISTDYADPVARTSALAHRVRVIAKRNALWQVFAALPDDKPVHFTLEVNPYRAALIEYCKSKGTLSLSPVSASEQRTLEEKRTRLLTQPIVDLHQVLFQEPLSGDYEQEENRIDAMNRGEYAIGNADLVRIFDLKTPPPPQLEVAVENFSALQRNRPTRFDGSGNLQPLEERRGKNTATPNRTGSTVNGFRFTCPTCDKKKQRGNHYRASAQREGTWRRT